MTAHKSFSSSFVFEGKDLLEAIERSGTQFFSVKKPLKRHFLKREDPEVKARFGENENQKNSVLLTQLRYELSHQRTTRTKTYHQRKPGDLLFFKVETRKTDKAVKALLKK